MIVDYLFVYGSLMSGFGNHRFLHDAKFISEARTKGLMFDAGPFPMAITDPLSYIYGEVYKINEDTLREIDYLEGHPDFYRRHNVNVIKDDGEEIRAWCYFVKPESVNKESMIGDGRWIKKYTNMFATTAETSS